MGKLKKRRGKVDEDPSETKINDYLYDNIKKLYVSHIPMDSVKELPMIYKLWAGSLAYAIFIGLFVYFVSVSYNNAVDQPFMSLQGGPNCGSVPALITGSYQADVEGYWIGTADFDYVYAIYDIGLGFFNQGQVGYQNGMAIFLSSIQAVSALAVKQDLAHNLLYWMNYHITLRFDSQSEMYFQFTGTPQQVFDLEYFHGQVSNVKGICQVDADVAYDYPTSSLTMDYNYQSFSKGANCEQSLSPFLTGYYPALDGTSFQIDLDMNSFTTAVSLNLGILDLNLMQPVPGKDYTVSFYGLNVTFTEFYDSRTPNMESVVCISHTVLASPSSTHGPTATQARIMNETLCFLKIGSAGIAIPVFNHVGASFASPIPCSCSTGVGLQQSCQEFNLMPSLLFYNVPLNSSVLSISAADTIAEFELFRLLVLINSTATYAELNAKAFNVSFSTIATVYPGYNQEINTLTWRRSAFKFCEITVGITSSYCSVITFQAFSPLTRAVSGYKYQLPAGSCIDSFSIPTPNWANLVENPPVVFVQDFFACTYDTFSAFLNALGIAQGNVQTALPFVVVATLPFMYLVLRCFGQTPPKAEYSKDEKYDAVMALGLQLLRLRDGKTRGLKPKGVLIALGKELIKAAKEEGGYPDSDDSDDDEEDEAGKDPESKAKKKKSIAASAPRKRSQLDVFLARPDEDDDDEADDEETGRKSKARPTLSYLRSVVNRRGGGSINSSSPMSKSPFFSESAIELGTFSRTDIKVLNGAKMNTDLPERKSPPIAVENLDQHLCSLILKLSAAIDANQPSSRPRDEDDEYDDEEGSEQMSSGSSPAYIEARMLAVELCKLDLDDFLALKDPTICIRLVNILTLHASVALGCPLREVPALYSSSVGYNIGGRTFTIEAFTAMCNSFQ